MVLHFSRTSGRNKFGQSFASEARKREVNDVGIAEKIKKERFYRSQRIGPAKLKQYYSHTALSVRHPPLSPERANLLSSAMRVNGGM
jgi:hypothetical protein